MPELQWDPFDFFYCLEVEPEIEKPWKTRYDYYVRRDDLVLKLTVRPMESMIDLSLRQSDSNAPLLKCALFVQREVVLINDKRGQYLEFRDCIMAPHRFSHREVAKFNDATTPSWMVELSIKPHIQIRYLD